MAETYKNSILSLLKFGWSPSEVTCLIMDAFPLLDFQISEIYNFAYRQQNK